MSGKLAEFESLAARYCRLRQIPRIWMANERRSRRFGRYAEYTRGLYQAIAQISGASILIDSSKNPARALALSQMRAIDLRLVHLVRDPRGVAASFGKDLCRNPSAGVQADQKARPARLVAREWSVASRMAEFVMNRIVPHKSVRVRYESLLSEPKATIHLLGDLLEIDYSYVATSIASGNPINIGHVVAGNRLRMKPEAHLRQSDDWNSYLDPASRLQIERYCRRRMQQYGYCAQQPV